VPTVAHVVLLERLPPVQELRLPARRHEIQRPSFPNGKLGSDYIDKHEHRLRLDHHVRTACSTGFLSFENSRFVQEESRPDRAHSVLANRLLRWGCSPGTLRHDKTEDCGPDGLHVPSLPGTLAKRNVFPLYGALPNKPLKQTAAPRRYRLRLACRPWKYPGLARRYRRPPRFLMRPLLNGGTLGGRMPRGIWRAFAFLVVAGALLALWKAVASNGTSEEADAKMKTMTVHVAIDEATVSTATDAFSLIEPLWDRVDIYGSWERYQATLRPFTSSQRHLFAIQWYRSEVNNGGHDQFFGNSTGIVWEHAVEGLQAIGLLEAATILKSASDRLGGASRDRMGREAQLEAAQADFEDVDDRFFELEKTGAFDQKMLTFARQHSADFRFNGTVERVVLPPLGERPN
jgi:hypothetical protein